MPSPEERFRSDEMAELMCRVQELMEASVIAMIIRRPTGGISVTCPPQRRDEVIALLRAYGWASLGSVEE